MTDPTPPSDGRSPPTVVSPPYTGPERRGPDRLPVFLEPTGRRWERIRMTVRAAAVLTSLLAMVVIVVALAAPNLAGLGSVLLPDRQVLGRPPRLLLTKNARERERQRRRLYGAIEQQRVQPGVRPTLLPIDPKAKRPGRVPLADERTDPIVAGFYVKWDTSSHVSLARYVRHLDWVVGEFAFVDPSGDSLRLDVDKRVFSVVDTVEQSERPRVFLMVSNATNQGEFATGARPLVKLVSTAAGRARAIAQIAAAVKQFGFAGVTLDFENFPASADPGMLAFTREVGDALRPLGAIVTQTIATDEIEADRAARYAAFNDYVFLMLYDEHYPASGAGPVASQAWFERHARDYLRYIPAKKTIVALGAYGYDWNDGETKVSNVSFQDVVELARNNGAALRWDARSLNPYLAWTDPDSTDHVVWYLDGASAYNQSRAAMRMGVAGLAVWRLGSEDPSMWRVIDRTGVHPDPQRLAVIDSLYNVDFVGRGEVLKIVATPSAGARTVQVDSATGLVVGQTTTALPSPYVVERAGAHPGAPPGQGGRMIALTFDDGPDGQWTPPILDTLKKYRVPATFFVIGQNAQRHLALTQRIYREGHEIGNHTYTHPNLALEPAWLARLEIDLTNRIIEAAVDRRTALFRPPFFGDAEPTTADELGPVSVASRLGFITAGLHLDAEDWDLLHVHTADEVVKNVLDAREARPLDGNVVLLHDGGGNRSLTVAALGPLIDSLRARGDTLVLFSELTGVPRDAAMPRLPRGSLAIRYAELAGFGLLGVGEWVLFWVLTTAVVLGLARLAFIMTLAAVHRVRSNRRGARLDALAAEGHPSPGHTYAPSVSVIVPAYNEEKVIVKTITSLLTQHYAGELEIVVVDDGSPDSTYEIAEHAYGSHPQVAVYTKPNGGKASALNFGIARARGDVVIGLDADTVFLPNTTAELVAPLADPKVGAVAGNAKVGNRVNIVTQWQAVEYVTSQNLDRRAFSLLDCITVVPGAVGAWRRALVLEVGGFSDDTLAEDQDLTLEIRRRGYSVAYADRAIAYTEAPDTLRGLAKQRFRWSFGTLQCMWKHRDAFLRPRYGSLGMVAMPNVWLFQLVFAAIGPVADLMFVLSLLSVWVNKVQHGATYALVNLRQILIYYAVFLVVDWLAAVLAFLMEPGEDKRLTWLIFLQRFAYRQVMYWVVVRSFAAALRGRVVGWGKLDRTGTVTVPGAGGDGRRWWQWWRSRPRAA